MFLSKHRPIRMSILEASGKNEKAGSRPEGENSRPERVADPKYISAELHQRLSNAVN